MVRYISKDELYHHGTLGMKWGKRLYQYPDGSLTPLGREHYGYKGTKDPRDPTDRHIAKYKAFVDTAKGYVTRSYKYAPAKKVEPKKEQTKEEKDREEELKRQAAREKAQNTKLEKKAAEVKAQTESKERVDKAKQNRWAEFTDDELRKYANRVALEAQATEALLKKIDAPRQIIDAIVSYGKTGYTAYKTYTDIMGLVDANKKKKMEAIKPSDPTDKMAEDLMAKFVKKYPIIKNDPKEVEKARADMWKDIQLLEASRTLFKISQGKDTGNSGGGKPDNNKNKGGGK